MLNHNRFCSLTGEARCVVNFSTRPGLLTDQQNMMPQYRRRQIALLSYVETSIPVEYYDCFLLFIATTVRLRPAHFAVYILTGWVDILAWCSGQGVKLLS